MKVSAVTDLSPLDGWPGSPGDMTVKGCRLSLHGVDVVNEIAELGWVDSLSGFLFLHHGQFSLALDGAVHVVSLHHEDPGVLWEDLGDVKRARRFCGVDLSRKMKKHIRNTDTKFTLGESS